jgi:hypothetical protein
MRQRTFAVGTADWPFGGPDASILMASVVVILGLEVGEVMPDPPQPKL